MAKAKTRKTANDLKMFNRQMIGVKMLTGDFKGCLLSVKDIVWKQGGTKQFRTSFRRNNQRSNRQIFDTYKTDAYENSRTIA